jgi:hypothetical protein
MYWDEVHGPTNCCFAHIRDCNTRNPKCERSLIPVSTWGDCNTRNPKFERSLMSAISMVGWREFRTRAVALNYTVKRKYVGYVTKEDNAVCASSTTWCRGVCQSNKHKYVEGYDGYQLRKGWVGRGDTSDGQIHTRTLLKQPGVTGRLMGLHPWSGMRTASSNACILWFGKDLETYSNEEDSCNRTVEGRYVITIKKYHERR